MGLDVQCLCHFGQESAEGRLQLEAGLLRFRGGFRLEIPTAEMTRVEAEGASLVVEWGDDQQASFRMAAGLAPKWVSKILSPPSLLDKLGVKTGMKVTLVGTFDVDFLADLAERTQASKRLAAGQDLILFAAATPKDLARVANIAGNYLAPAGALWVVYAKGRGHAIGEGDVRSAALDAGLVDTKVCAFSNTHTASKWVRPRSARPS